MTLGAWRDGFPRLRLTLMGERGPLDLEFIIDTGFNGDLALPEVFVARTGESRRQERIMWNLPEVFGSAVSLTR